MCNWDQGDDTVFLGHASESFDQPGPDAGEVELSTERRDDVLVHALGSAANLGSRSAVDDIHPCVRLPDVYDGDAVVLGGRGRPHDEALKRSISAGIATTAISSVPMTIHITSP